MLYGWTKKEDLSGNVLTTPHIQTKYNYHLRCKWKYISILTFHISSHAECLQQHTEILSACYNCSFRRLNRTWKFWTFLFWQTVTQFYTMDTNTGYRKQLGLLQFLKSYTWTSTFISIVKQTVKYFRCNL